MLDSRKRSNVPPNAPTDLHSRKPGFSEPLTKAQADSVVTREDLPAKPFRIALTLAVLVILLFGAYVYYSNISP